MLIRAPSGEGNLPPVENSWINPPRELPHNIPAEQALLGALLIENAAAERVADIVREDDFFDPLHRQIFGEIMRTIAAGRLATPVTLRPVFEADDPITEHLTVVQYLGSLAAGATTLINVEHYARAVADLAKRRELVAIGERIVETAYRASLDETAETQIETAEAALLKIADNGSSSHVEITFDAAAEEAVKMAADAYQSGGMMRGLSTGLADLDAKLGGLQNSDLIILAGRPSMGKTALATNIAWSVARQGLAVDFRSLEMSAEQLATRILAADIGVPSEKLRRGTGDEADIRSLMEAQTRLHSTPLVIDQTGGLTIGQLSARARRAKRKHGTALIVVDYLQLMRGTGRGREANRVQEITEITTGLKALAKELQVPILALSQLSRAVEGRTEKRPQLSDLRESGSIEQDADVVLFVYREEYYVSRAEPDPGDFDKHAAWQAEMRRVSGRAEVIIGKQRHGPTGIVPLAFDGAMTRFDNLAREVSP